MKTNIKTQKASALRFCLMSMWLLVVPCVDAANLYWDGGTTNIAGDGDGAGTSAAGTWNTTIQNWDGGISPHVAWNNTTNANDTANIFASGNYAINITSDINLGGLNTTWSGATRTLSLSSTTSTLNFSEGSVISNNTGSASNYGAFTITAGISGAPIFNISAYTSTSNTFNPSSGLSQHIGAINVTGVGADSLQTLSGASGTVNYLDSFHLVSSSNTANRHNLTMDNGTTATWEIGEVSSLIAIASARITINANAGLMKFTGDVAAQTLNVGNAVNDNATVEFTKSAATLNIDNVTMTGGILKNSSGGTLTFTTAAADNTNNNRIGNSGIRFEGNDMVFESNRIIKLNSATTTVNVITAGQTVTFSGNVNHVTAGNGLTKSGSGTLVLGGTNGYTGATIIDGGTLRIASGGTFNSTSSITVNSGARFEYNSATGLNRTLTINGGDFRYNSSANYTGAFTHTAGTISGTNWNGSLNNQTIATGEFISPGNSPGTASTGSQTWATGGTYVWEINSTLGSAGADPGWDLINGTGTLDITAAAGSEFTINITSLALTNLAGNVSNFSDALNYNWLIADFASVTGFDSSDFILNTSNFSNTYTGQFGISQGGVGIVPGDNSQIYLTYTAIPEPKTMLLGAISVLLLLRRRR